VSLQTNGTSIRNNSRTFEHLRLGAYTQTCGHLAKDSSWQMQQQQLAPQVELPAALQVEPAKKAKTSARNQTQQHNLIQAVAAKVSDTLHCSPGCARHHPQQQHEQQQ
jgi:hypothetical protein